MQTENNSSSLDGGNNNKRARKSKKNNKVTFKLVTIYFIILCSFSVLIAFGVNRLFRDFAHNLPSPQELINYEISLPSKVYDCRGKLIHTFATEQRVMVNYEDLPQHLKDAITATEDSNFYTHFGIDILGTFRALVTNIIRGSASQGASTLTQQLARNLFLTHERSYTRKIKEAMVTLMIEKEFSKEQIMEIYFNKVYLGEGVYGVARAARYYFGKDVSELSISECATLVGMLQRPNYFNPRKRVERTIQRRNTVLHRMYVTGKISKQEYESEKKTSLLCVSREYDELNSYYLYYIGNQLAKKFGKKRLYEDGLSIYLTVDWDLNCYADSVMQEQLAKIEDWQDYRIKYSDFPADSTDFRTPYLQGGLVVADAHTGEVRAMLGGRNYKHSKLNRMMQSKRQIGSSIKPIIYTAALENGYTPSTVMLDDRFSVRLHGYDRIPHLEDAPDSLLADSTYVDSLLKLEKKYLYTPTNYGKNYGGYIRLRRALRNSFNIFAVKTVYDVGKITVSKKAKMFGVKFPPYYSSALGTSEIKPVDMVKAFTAFVNQGKRVKLIYIDSVYDRYGNLIEKNKTQSIKVCEPDIAYLMANMMRSVTRWGGTAGSSFSGHDYYVWDSAGKTGTTDDYRDAWFIGMNNQYVCGIWHGFDNYSVIKKDTARVQFDSLGFKIGGMGHGVGGGSVAPIAAKIMGRLILNDNNGVKPPRNDSRYTFKKPANVVEALIDKTTGFRTTRKENSYKEVFSNRFPLPQFQRPGLKYNFPPLYSYDDPVPLIVDELNN